MVETVLAGSGAVLVLLGLVIVGPSLYYLGRARAAKQWPGDSRGRGRLAGTGTFFGVLLVAAGAAVVGALGPLVFWPDSGWWPQAVSAAGAGLVTFGVGLFATAKLAERAELNALIRGPSPLYRTAAQTASEQGQQPVTAGSPATQRLDADPDVPPTAHPGWVYRDAAGTWYLVVAAGTGFRLVELPSFKLVAPGSVRPPVTAAGSVELSVWPLDGRPEVSTRPGVT